MKGFAQGWADGAHVIPPPPGKEHGIMGETATNWEHLSAGCYREDSLRRHTLTLFGFIYSPALCCLQFSILTPKLDSHFSLFNKKALVGYWHFLTYIFKHLHIYIHLLFSHSCACNSRSRKIIWHSYEGLQNKSPKSKQQEMKNILINISCHFTGVC